MPEESDMGEMDTPDYFSDEIATFGDRLAAAREALSLNQAEFAKKLGVKAEVIRAWENDLKEPRANRLQMLAGMLNVSMRWLMTGEGDGIETPLDPDDNTMGDLRGALMELRGIRTEQSRLAERLARLEKKLRLLVE
jgi:transcriptional regulator with XRE-family HTH domain